MATGKDLNCQNCKERESNLYPACDFIEIDDEGHIYCKNFVKDEERRKDLLKKLKEKKCKGGKNYELKRKGKGNISIINGI
ncbi:MAG: hypothetical protein ACOC4G_12965 [Bacillota bacterium]